MRSKRTFVSVIAALGVVAVAAIVVALNGGGGSSTSKNVAAGANRALTTAAPTPDAKTTTTPPTTTTVVVPALDDASALSLFHASRILQSASSPSGTYVAFAAYDDPASSWPDGVFGSAIYSNGTWRVLQSFFLPCELTHVEETAVISQGPAIFATCTGHGAIPWSTVYGAAALPKSPAMVLALDCGSGDFSTDSSGVIITSTTYTLSPDASAQGPSTQNAPFTLQWDPNSYYGNSFPLYCKVGYPSIAWNGP